MKLSTINVCITLLFCIGIINCELKTLEIQLNDKTNGETFTVTNQNSVIISIEGNRTTGYQWYLDDVENVRKTLVIVGLNSDNTTSNIKSANNKDGFVGAPELNYFEFSVMNPGTTKLKFNYKRSFEPGVVQTYTINLKVDEIKNDLITTTKIIDDNDSYNYLKVISSLILFSLFLLL